MSKPLNENMQKVLRYVNSVQEAMSVPELAEAAGVSQRYVRYHAEDISTYKDATITKEESDWVEARSINYYLSDVADIKTALGCITGYLMKYRYNLLGHIRKADKIKRTGYDVISLVAVIKSRKQSTGTPIHAQSTAVRSLLKQNKVAFIDKLFIRSNGYYAGHTSKKWRTTPFADKMISEAIDILFVKIGNDNVVLPTLFRYTFTSLKWVTYSSICCPLKLRNYKWYEEPIQLLLKEVRSLCFTSILHIFANTITYLDKKFIVSLNHTSNTNPALGRHYNVFARLRSAERKQLGYNNYDISAALQTISLQLIQATESDYPLLMRYATDNAFKTQIRKDIATSLSVSLDGVKAKLTAFANGAVSGKDKHKLYKQFQEESDRLRREVLAHTARHKPGILQNAIAQSKKKLPEDIDWFSLAAEDKQSMARAKASVYFFIWTYSERAIRKAMLSVIPNGIQVHDAVYSKATIDNKAIEAEVLNSTGFTVQITN